MTDESNKPPISLAAARAERERDFRQERLDARCPESGRRARIRCHGKLHFPEAGNNHGGALPAAFSALPSVLLS